MVNSYLEPVNDREVRKAIKKANGDVQDIVVKPPKVVVHPPQVNVAAPKVTVTPTPVTINQKEVKFPVKQKVEVINPNADIDYDILADKIADRLPIGYRNDPKQADPYKYIVVRLSDGERMYKAVERGIAAAGASNPFSLEQQSEDQAKTIVYRTDISDSAGVYNKIDYIQFVAVDTNTYRKTYLYDDQSRMVGWTGWIKQ